MDAKIAAEFQANLTVLTRGVGDRYADRNLAGVILEDLADLSHGVVGDTGIGDFKRKLTQDLIDFAMAGSPERKPNQCPGCNGEGVPAGGHHKVFKCNDCGGAFSLTTVEPHVVQYYAPVFSSVGEGFCKCSMNHDTTYFDFMFNNGGKQDRVHGWTCDNCHKVTQIG